VSRTQQRLSAKAGVLAAECLRAQRQAQPSAQPFTMPVPQRCSCGCVHDSEDLAISQKLADAGVLQWRVSDNGEGGVFRGDVSQVPSRIHFLISPEMDAAAPGWHRVYFRKVRNSRRKELCLYRGESETIQ
jgi:hypothetical protein